AGERVAVEPGVERGHGGSGGADRAHQARGHVVAGRPVLDVGVVDQGGGAYLRSCGGHAPRHVAAHPPALLGLVPCSGARRPGAVRARRSAGVRVARARPQPARAARSPPSPAGGGGLVPVRSAPSPPRGGGLGGGPAAAAEPSAAARFTSAIVTTPSAPLPRT